MVGMRKVLQLCCTKLEILQHTPFINPLPCDALDLYFVCICMHCYVLCLLFEDFIIFVYVARYHMPRQYHMLTLSRSQLLFTVNLSDSGMLQVGVVKRLLKKVSGIVRSL